MRRLLRRLGLFALVLASAVATHHALPFWTPGGRPLTTETTPPFEVPRDPTSIYLNNMHGELSQPILYHGIGASIAQAKAADVVFFGDSRLPMGLREEFILPRAQRSGLRVFSLACGNAESGGFLLELIRKHDLRPKVLVFSGGVRLFHGGMSDRARDAVRLSRWQARQEVFETRVAWEIRRRLHRRLPKIDPWDPPTFDRWVVVYRSQATGWWQPVWERTSRYVFEYPPEAEVAPAILERATDFMDRLTEELDRRGTLLVLTAVPWGRESHFEHLPVLGSRYGVPVVPPLVAEGMATLDGSHLDRDSARRASETFWEGFIRLPRVRERLALPPLG